MNVERLLARIRLRFEAQAVPGAAFQDLDPLLVDRFTIDDQGDPAVQLKRLHLLTDTDAGPVPTVAGVLLCTLTPYYPVENPEFGKHQLMDRRGSGVRLILERSTACSGRRPVYTNLDDMELLLTIYAAAPPRITDPALDTGGGESASLATPSSAPMSTGSSSRNLGGEDD